MDDNTNGRRAAGDTQIEVLNIVVKVHKDFGTDGEEERARDVMILDEALLELIHGYVSDGALHLTLYEAESELKSLAEEFGFNFFIERLKYV